MQKENKKVHNNVNPITDPYQQSIKALYRDLEEQIESVRRHLEYLEKLKRDLERQQRKVAA
jgi:hypothetical protein